MEKTEDVGSDTFFQKIDFKQTIALLELGTLEIELEIQNSFEEVLFGAQ